MKKMFSEHKLLQVRPLNVFTSFLTAATFVLLLQFNHTVSISKRKWLLYSTDCIKCLNHNQVFMYSMQMLHITLYHYQESLLISSIVCFFFFFKVLHTFSFPFNIYNFKDIYGREKTKKNCNLEIHLCTEVCKLPLYSRNILLTTIFFDI